MPNLKTRKRLTVVGCVTLILVVLSAASLVVHSAYSPPFWNRFTVEAQPIVKEQLQKAGIRLASLLDKALGD